MEASIPLILLSTERSGTNLLRAIIGSHSSVTSPPPSGLIRLLGHRVYTYLYPEINNHGDALARDMIALTQTHLNPWEDILQADQVVARAGSRSFWPLFRAMNDIYAKQRGCHVWLSKEPGLFWYIYEIALNMPDARFIYLVRDARDVALSMLRGGLHAHHVYHAAKSWSQQQRVCLNALSDPLIAKRSILLTYEGLIDNPVMMMKKVMAFAGLEFENDQLLFYKNENVLKHALCSDLWENLLHPVNRLNKGTYKSSLTRREIAIIEAVAWKEMIALGYRPESAHRKTIHAYERIMFRMASRIRRTLKLLHHDKERDKHLARRNANRTILSQPRSIKEGESP